LKCAIVGLVRLFHRNHFTCSQASSGVTFIAEQNGGMRNAVESNCSVLCHILRESDEGGRDSNSESRSRRRRLPNVNDRTAEIRQYDTPLVASNLRESVKF
jgi:hypothetical protein